MFFGVAWNLHTITGIVSKLDHKVSFHKFELYCSLNDLSFDTIFKIPSHCSTLQWVTLLPIYGWKLTFWPDEGYWSVKGRTTLVQLDTPTSKKVNTKLRYECCKNRVWFLRLSCDLKALLWIVRGVWRDMEPAMTSHKAISVSQASRTAQHVQRDTRPGPHYELHFLPVFRHKSVFPSTTIEFLSFWSRIRSY